MKSEYMVCTRCVMDTSDPDIHFDEMGVCNHCTAYYERAGRELRHQAAKNGELHQLIEAIKAEGKGRDYDCIIGVSGGVDSTMVAFYCSKLGLRPLAVHFDNGWDSELAVSNIEKTLRRLNIDLFTFVVDWEEFRDLQLSFLKASVPNIEIPSDHAIQALLFRVAEEKGIRFIISGSNIETESIMPRSWTYDHRDYRHLKQIHRRFGTRKLRTYPHYGLLDFFRYVFVRRIKFVKLLNYFPYNKHEAIQTIEKELGWINYGGKHYESVFTRFYQAYILPRKFGYDKRRPHYSTLICSGQLTREQAVESLKHGTDDPARLREDREYVIKKLGLTEQEFEGIMSQPMEAHRNYPSNQFIFSQDKFGLLTLARRMVVR